MGESRGASAAAPGESLDGRGPAEGATGSPSTGESGALSFEEALSAAEGAVESLERGDLSLERSLAMYEDGLGALKRCYEILRGAERRIEVLGADLGGVVEGGEGPEWRPAASHPGLRDVLGALSADSQEAAGDRREGPGAEGTGGP